MLLPSRGARGDPAETASSTRVCTERTLIYCEVKLFAVPACCKSMEAKLETERVILT